MSSDSAWDVVVNVTFWCGNSSTSDEAKGHSDGGEAEVTIKDGQVLCGDLPEGWTANEDKEAVLCAACSKKAGKRKKG